MKNQKVLNYCPSLNTITGSITASLLMCQLEYWFDKTKGESFYKFLEPCTHSHYKKKDSWTEEMGFSKAEFRLAFSRIGKVYKSKKAFLESKNRFDGKFYLSYYDRHTKLTYYMRNTNLVTKLLRSKQCELLYTKDYNSSISPSSSIDNKIDIQPDTLIQLFTKYCPSLKAHTHLSPKCRTRLKHLLNLLEQKGLEILPTLRKTFKLVEESDFLCGRLPYSTWHAALSWILRPDKFFAILSGKYAPFKPTSPTLPKSSSSPSSSMSRFIHSFHRVESHNFDLTQLEAKEQAYHMSKHLQSAQQT